MFQISNYSGQILQCGLCLFVLLFLTLASPLFSTLKYCPSAIGAAIRKELFWLYNLSFFFVKTMVWLAVEYLLFWNYNKCNFARAFVFNLPREKIFFLLYIFGFIGVVFYLLLLFYVTDKFNFKSWPISKTLNQDEVLKAYHILLDG